MLTNLLQCDVMLLIMQTILKRANDLKARSFSDSHLQKVIMNSFVFFYDVKSKFFFLILGPTLNWIRYT